MGWVGFEQPPATASKKLISEGGGAKSDARSAPKAPNDPDLDRVLEASPGITTHIKAGIETLIRTI